MKETSKILVLEDQPLQRMQIEQILSENHYDVIAVGTVSKAKEMLEKHDFDLALLDIQMEREDEEGGIKIGELIGGSIPFIYLTAREDLFQKALPTRPDDFIAKPYHPDDILRKVQLTRFRFHGEKEKISGALMATLKGLRIKVDSFWNSLAYRNITFVQAEGNDTTVFTDLKNPDQGTRVYHIKGAQFGKLAKYLEKIHGDRFQRVHKGFLVAKPFITKYNRHEVVVAGFAIKIGETYKRHVLNWLEKDS